MVSGDRWDFYPAFEDSDGWMFAAVRVHPGGASDILSVGKYRSHSGIFPIFCSDSGDFPAVFLGAIPKTSENCEGKESVNIVGDKRRTGRFYSQFCV